MWYFVNTFVWYVCVDGQESCLKLCQKVHGNRKTFPHHADNCCEIPSLWSASTPLPPPSPPSPPPLNTHTAAYRCVTSWVPLETRKFKKLLRRRKRERHKTIGYNEKNKGPVRALLIFVHFSTVLGQTTT